MWDFDLFTKRPCIDSRAHLCTASRIVKGPGRAGAGAGAGAVLTPQYMPGWAQAFRGPALPRPLLYPLGQGLKIRKLFFLFYIATKHGVSIEYFLA